MKNDITINYQEAAVLTGLSTAVCKELFQKILNKDKVDRDEETDIFRLDIHSKNIRSHDARYHDNGLFTTHAQLSKANYRKYLSHKSFIQQGVFPGGATVFLKICTPAQLEHINKKLAYYGHDLITENLPFV